MTRESPQIRWVRPQQTRSQETLGRLCDAAGELLNDKPIDQISIEEIAAMAGSSVQSSAPRSMRLRTFARSEGRGVRL